MNEGNQTLQGNLLISLLITTAFMASVLIYVFLAMFLVSRGQTFPEAGGRGLQAMLVTAAVFGAAGAVGTFRIQMTALASGTQSLPPEIALSRLLRARIIGLALAESAAIMGLVLTLISNDINWSLALSALALGVMAYLWPRRRQLERIVIPGEVRPIEPD